jgi:hypothetical protein
MSSDTAAVIPPGINAGNHPPCGWLVVSILEPFGSQRTFAQGENPVATFVGTMVLLLLRRRTAARFAGGMLLRPAPGGPKPGPVFGTGSGHRNQKCHLQRGWCF